MRLPLLPKWLRFLLVASVVFLIVWFSITPLPRWVTDSGPLGLLPIRKYLHLIAYAGLALVMGYALAENPRPDWQVLTIVFLVAVGLGLSLEGLQATLPHRHASLEDAVMNAAGAALAVGIWRVLFRQAQLYRVETPVELPN